MSEIEGFELSLRSSTPPYIHCLVPSTVFWNSRRSGLYLFTIRPNICFVMGARFACIQVNAYAACSALWPTELDGLQIVSDSSQTRNGSEATSNSIHVRRMEFVSLK